MKGLTKSQIKDFSQQNRLVNGKMVKESIIKTKEKFVK